MDLEDQYDKLYRYCYFRVRDVQTAEDLVQETFLRWLDHYPGQRLSLIHISEPTRRS